MKYPFVLLGAALSPARRLAVAALALICLSSAGWYAFTTQHSAARTSDTKISERAQEIVEAFWGPVERMTFPYYHPDSSLKASPGLVYVWKVKCESNGLTLDFSFSDADGHLCEVEGTLDEFKANRSVAPIETAREAAEVGRHRLEQFHLLPTGAQTSFIKSPIPMNHDRAWQIVWNVQPTGAVKPYPVFMIIDRRTGALLWLMDRHDMDR